MKVSSRTQTTLSKNAGINLVRVGANSLIALIVPAYLTHRLPVSVYGAWVLILQLAAYVTFLDLGVQTGIAKFVAEFEARGDNLGAGRLASAGFALMVITAMAGVALTWTLSIYVPQIFHSMPAAMYRDVRISVILVGSSSCVGLASSAFASVFIGLQRYVVPTSIAIVNRTAFAAVVVAAVHAHRSLVTMGALVAAVNIATSIVQVVAWQKLAAHVRVSLGLVKRAELIRVVRYCSLMAFWTAGMLCVSGLDVTLVGRYAYDQTAYYSIATLPTSFVMVILASVLNPLMPASSALSTQRSPTQMGEILLRMTRYSTTLLLLAGLPIMVCGSQILTMWVGPLYAQHSLKYLQLLILANIIRSLCGPYATFVAGTGRLKVATVAPVVEALVNVASSIYLAQRYGAVGVAMGTLLGSLVSVSLHFTLSMTDSRRTLNVAPGRLFAKGLVIPAMISLPSLVIAPLWWSSSRQAIPLPLFAVWGMSTLVLAWFWSLNKEERVEVGHFLRHQMA